MAIKIDAILEIKNKNSHNLKLHLKKFNHIAPYPVYIKIIKVVINIERCQR